MAFARFGGSWRNDELVGIGTINAAEDLSPSPILRIFQRPSTRLSGFAIPREY
jgi:hypothetical protein